MTITKMNQARILVVDDEPTLRLGFTYALKTENHEVLSASGGREAIGQLEKSPVDVVILDLRMPDLDGIETLALIKKLALEPKVILCSAHINTESACRALELGCFDFLSKPVKPDDLRRAVNRACQVSPPEDKPLESALFHLRKSQPERAVAILKPLLPSTDPVVEFWHAVSSRLCEENPVLPQSLFASSQGNIGPLLAFQSR